MNSANKGSYLLPLFFLFLVTFASFYSGLDGGFISDDWPQIAQNPYLESFDSLPGFFTKGVWGNSAMDDLHQNIYRPMFLLWNFSIFYFFGASAISFHVALLLLHCLNIFLFYRILDHLWPESLSIGKTFAVLIFAIHPAQTHCLTWISGGTDVILAFFIFFSFLAYLNYCDKKEKKFLFYSYLFFFLALLTKETAVVYPLLLIAYDWITKKNTPLPKSFFGGLFLLLFIYLIIRSSVLNQGALQFSAERILRVFEFLFSAIWYLFFPFDMPFYFQYIPGGVATAEMWVFGGVGFALSIYVFFRTRAYIFPVVWFYLFVLPPLGIAFNENGVFAIRFLYLPIAGLSLGLIVFFENLSISRKTLTVCTALLASLFVLLNNHEIKVWENEEVFFKKVLKLNPSAKEGYQGLSIYYQRHERFNEAIDTLEMGVSNVVMENNNILLLENLALQYADLGQNSKSIEAYLKLLNTNKKEDALIGLANNYWVLQDFENARRFYKNVIQANPNNFFALYNYAKLNEQTSHPDEAELYYKKLINLPVKGKEQQKALLDARRFLNYSGE